MALGVLEQSLFSLTQLPHIKKNWQIQFISSNRELKSVRLSLRNSRYMLCNFGPGSQCNGRVWLGYSSTAGDDFIFFLVKGEN